MGYVSTDLGVFYSLTLDDLQAIKVYFDNTSAATSNAQEIKDKFYVWYADLGWFAKSADLQTTINEARSRRNAFNLANATTETEKQQVQDVFKYGLTTEEGQGEARPYIDPTTGQVGHPPMIPLKYKIIGGIAATIVIIYVVRRTLRRTLG